MRVSVVIPVYNEALAIYELLRRIFQADLKDSYEFEVIISDDGSTDETIDQVKRFVADHPQEGLQIKLHSGLINHGKGATLRAGFKLVSGEIIIIQDGDLEYSPADYTNLLKPFSNPNIHVVYGSRFLQGNPKGMKFLNLLANKILTLTTQVLYQQPLTDEATGYKVFRSGLLKDVSLKCRGFEFCPEFTSKVLQFGYKIVEVPISYNPRGILEGKKIKATDGFIAVWWLLKLRLSFLLSKKSFHPTNSNVPMKR